MSDDCANCGALIGNLEQPHVYRDNIVCAACHARLTTPPALVPAPQHAIPYAAPAMPAPMHAARVPHLPPPLARPMVIERTSKVWKLQQLIAAGVVLLGIVLMCGGVGAGKNGAPLAGLGFIMLFGGMVWLVVARVGAWWCHG